MAASAATNGHYVASAGFGRAILERSRVAAVALEKALQHVGDEFGHWLGFAIALAVEFRVGVKLPVQIGAHCDRDIDGRPVG